MICAHNSAIYEHIEFHCCIFSCLIGMSVKKFRFGEASADRVSSCLVEVNVVVSVGANARYCRMKFIGARSRWELPRFHWLFRFGVVFPAMRATED
jgi:hypothetical protein